MYVYTPVRNNAGRATTLARSPTTLSPANHPRRALLFHEAATILTVPHQPLPLPIRSTTDHPHRPSFPPTTPPRPPPPVTHSSQLCEHGVTASTIRNAHHHPLLSPITYAVLPSLTYLSLSLSVSTSVFLKRPIQSTRRVRPYGAVSTGTPARSLKENAIIRRTSTNELIVGASRYRQYREVLYSTSPGATRL